MANIPALPTVPVPTTPAETLHETFAKILAAGATPTPPPSYTPPVSVASARGHTWLQLLMIGAVVILVLFVAGVCMKRSYERYLGVNNTTEATMHVADDMDFDHIMASRTAKKNPTRTRRRPTIPTRMLDQDSEEETQCNYGGNRTYSDDDDGSEAVDDTEAEKHDPNFTKIE